MKRKLISYDAFESIQKDSLTNAEKELVEATPYVAKALNMENLKMSSFGPEKVLYETEDGTYVHASYVIENGEVKLKNIEELAIDTDDEKTQSRNIVSNMLEAVFDDQTEKADQLFNDYLSLPFVHRSITEGNKNKKQKKMIKNMKKGKNSSQCAIADDKKDQEDVKEWAKLYENITNYVSYKEMSPVFKQTQLAYDEKGNVSNINLPTAKLRNEAKLLSFNWKTLDTDCKVLRSNAKMLSEDVDFCKAITQIKKYNNASYNEKLEENLENLVSKYPQILYVTENELSNIVKEALDFTNERNYDDETCDFIAEGILRTAHNAYVDRVNKIMQLAGVEPCDQCEDKYAQFKETVDGYFNVLDESAVKEMQVFVDLYEALRTAYQMADKNENVFVKKETASYLDELVDVLQRQSDPSIKLAVEAANWLKTLVETNLETKPWDVQNNTHVSVNGNHPDMVGKARHSYKPASDFTGDWGDPAPVSDGKNYRGNSDEMRNNSWGNIGKETWPNLNNPYVPNGGEYTMKGEKGVDKDSDQGLSHNSKETWPNLTNPYIPNSVQPKVNNDNAIVDQ